MKKKKKVSYKKLLKHKIFRKRNIFSLTILLLTLIIATTLCILNIIPLKYLLLIVSSLLILNTISIILINVHEKTYLKIIGYILIALTILSSGISLYYIVNTKNFIKSSFANKKTYTKNTYYVISNSTDYINDETTYIVGTFKNSANIVNAFEKLNNKYVVNEVKYDDMELLINDLNNGVINLALLDKASYEIYFQIKQELNKTDYNVLYEYDSYEKNNSSISENKDIINIYVEGKDQSGISDFNMIATVNIKDHKILLTAIPREYYIEVAGKEGRYDSLNSISTYDSNTSKESLEKLLNIEIDYNIKIDSSNIVSIVDYLNGIEFESDKSFETTKSISLDPYTQDGKKLKIKKGKQRLDGIETLTLARETKAFENGEIVRHENCIKITEAIANKILSTKALFHYNETLNNINTLYTTNIPKNLAEKLVKETLDNDWKIEIQSVNGEEGYEPIHLSSIYGNIIYPDYDSVEQAKNNINEISKK